MLARLSELYEQGKFGGFHAFKGNGLARWMASSSILWIVYAKRPFRTGKHVLKYLGGYTLQVAISNTRLVSCTETEVRFRTKNGYTMPLSPMEFLRRFIDHVPPVGFHKIRHYDLYASPNVTEPLKRAREHSFQGPRFRGPQIEKLLVGTSERFDRPRRHPISGLREYTRTPTLRDRLASWPKPAMESGSDS